MLDGKSPETFEEEIKKKFVKEPAKMKLLIVVDKLLTGFDAPSATYLYIDKSMRDHGLFQAICRVNRLDDESKEYGYIVDYKDLFKSLEKSITDYTSEAFDQYDKEDVQGLLKDRLAQGRERLDGALEDVIALCEPVHPRDQEDFIHYFCGDTSNMDDLKQTEERRVMLYKKTAALIRAYANLANEMQAAGYSKAEAERIKERVSFYTDLRETIKRASGDYIDLKAYEPGMRQLIDMYILAEPSRKISAFEDMSLVELILERGEEGIGEAATEARLSQEAMAETIENNLRKVIIEERPTNPKYFDRMSELLGELIQRRKEEALAYEAYLKEVVALTRKVGGKGALIQYPLRIRTRALQALYDNLDQDEELAILMDQEIRYVLRDGWRGNLIKERAIRNAINKVLPDGYDLDEFFDIVNQQREY